VWSGEVRTDLRQSPTLGTRQLEGQPCEEPLRQRSGAGERRSARRLTAPVVVPHRQLLSEQFVELDAPPRGMRACLQRLLWRVGGWVVQIPHALAEPGKLPSRHDLGGQRIGEIRVCQCPCDQAAQHVLREAGRGRIHGRQRLGERLGAAQHRVARMDHLCAEESALELPHHSQPDSCRELAHLAGIEVEEAQRQLLAAIARSTDEDAPGAKLDLGVDYLDLDLYALPGQRIAQRGQVRFVLVAQRQVQHQVQVRMQPELFQQLARGRRRSTTLFSGLKCTRLIFGHARWDVSKPKTASTAEDAEERGGRPSPVPLPGPG
jgi:hypothetical protein